jgi:hypothetical protein
MLTIEKDNEGKFIAIREKSSDGRWNRTFLAALAIAFFLHSAAALLIQVEPIQVSETLIVLSPASVQSDLNLTEGSNLVASKIEPRQAKLFLLPPTSKLPTISEPAKTPFLTSMISFNKDERISPRFFDVLKRGNRITTIDPIPSSNDLKVTFQIFGKLTNRTLATKIKEYSSKQPFHVICEVQVDDRTGKIFWSEFYPPLLNQEAEQIAENLLSELTFAPKTNSFITKGTIEIVATAESGNKGTDL